MNAQSEPQPRSKRSNDVKQIFNSMKRAANFGFFMLIILILLLAVIGGLERTYQIFVDYFNDNDEMNERYI